MANVSIQGVITKVHKKDKDTGFCIVTIKGADDKSKALISSKKSGRDTITVLGTYFGPKPGEHITCNGYFKQNDKFGVQLGTTSILSTGSLKKFFTDDVVKSEIFRSLESSERAKLVKRFGDKSVYTAITNPDMLAAENIISENSASSLKADAQRISRMVGPFNYLRALGFPPKPTYHAVEWRGGQSAVVATSDPYEFLSVPSVGFKSIDKIAHTLGMEMDSHARLKHCLGYLIDNHIESGNTSFKLEKMTDRAVRELGVSKEVIHDFLRDQVKKGELIVYVDENKMPILAPYQLYNLEKEVAANLRRLCESSMRDRIGTISVDEGYLKKGQVNGVRNSVLNKVSIITGGPGVGKTTVLKAVLDNVKEAQGESHKIVLAAPTGKAARRMSESTGINASTIHTMLEYHPEDGYRKNTGAALDADTIVIDEASMVDLELFAAMLEAVPSHARLVIVGDVDQLDSVGPGAVLKDIINSGAITVSELTETLRQGKDSLIITAAHAVNKGQMPEMNSKSSDDYQFIRAGTDEEIRNKILNLTRAIPAKYGIELDNIQVLSPQKGTAAGVNQLNDDLRDIMNPSSGKRQFTFRSFGRDFKINDRVMQVRNDKELNINNGEVGKIKEFDMKAQEVKIEFDEFTRTIPLRALGNMRLAYAKTIHKSQGSEYGAVIIPVSDNHSGMLSQQLLYTGITRGKKLVFLVGSEDAMQKAVRNENKQVRETSLKRAIENSFSESTYKPVVQDFSSNVRVAEPDQTVQAAM